MTALRHTAFVSPELPGLFPAQAAEGDSPHAITELPLPAGLAEPTPPVQGGRRAAGEPLFTLPPLRGAARRSRGGAGEPRGTEGAAEPDRDPRPAAPDLPGAEAALLAMRAEQIAKHGHTPEEDASRPIADFLDHMLREVVNRAHGAAEHHASRTGLRNVRTYLVKLGAVCLAAVERIDGELEPEHG